MSDVTVSCHSTLGEARTEAVRRGDLGTRLYVRIAELLDEEVEVKAPGQAVAELSRVGAMALVRAQHARRGTSSGIDAACELVLTRLSEQLGQARRVASEPRPAPFLAPPSDPGAPVVAELESIRLGPEAPENP